MSPEKTQAIVNRARKQRLYNKASVILLTVMALSAPFVVYLFDFGMTNREWRFDIISQFIREGTIWVVPNHALFQTNALLFSRGDNPSGIAVLTFIAGFAVVFTLIYLIVSKILSSVLARVILAKTRPYLSSEKSAIFNTAPALSSSTKDIRTLVAFRGNSLIYSQPLSRPLPDIYIDSRDNNLARHEGASFRLPRDYEVILNGTLFEQFKIYIHPEYHDKASLLFSSEVIAVLTKQLGNCEILIQNGLIYLVLPTSAQTIPKQVDLIVQELSHLNQLLSNAMRKNSLSLKEDTHLTLKRHSFIKLPLGIVVHRSVYYGLLALLLTPTLLLCLLAPNWVNLSDMFAVASLVAIAFIISFFQDHRQRTAQGELS